MVVCLSAVVAILGPHLPSIASTPDVAWHRVLRAGLEAVAVAADGSVYVTGSVRRYRAPWDTWAVLQRFSASGAHVWTRRWNPPNAWSEGIDVEALPDGSVVWAGAMNVESMEGGLWFLRRYTPTGHLLWRRTAPSWRAGGASRIRDVATGAGVIVAVGDDFGCCGDPYREGWVRAFGLDGSPRWTSAFEFPDVRPRWFDAAQAVAVGAHGRISVAGWAALGRISFDGEPVRRHLVVQQLAPDGGHIWTWRTAIRGSRRLVEAAGVAARGPLLMVVARLGGWVVPGSPSRGTAWIGRLGFEGRLRWSRTWGDDGEAGAQPTDVEIARDGKTYVVGSARAPSEDRLRGFLRAYGGGGRRFWMSRFETDSESLLTTGVAARSDRLIVTGTMLIGRWDDARAGGHVWSFGVGS
jgi:hypothetical protein